MSQISQLESQAQTIDSAQAIDTESEIEESEESYSGNTRVLLKPEVLSRDNKISMITSDNSGTKAPTISATRGKNRVEYRQLELAKHSNMESSKASGGLMAQMDALRSNTDNGSDEGFINK